MGRFADKLNTLVEESRDDPSEDIAVALEQKLAALREEETANEDDEAAEAAEDEGGSDPESEASRQD